MGWTLDQVRDVSVEDYDALIEWVKAKAARAEQRSSGEGGVIDADVLVAARQAKDAKDRGSD